MTPEQHNKLGGILHLVYGGFQSMVFLGLTALIAWFYFYSGEPMTEDDMIGAIVVGGFSSLMWLMFGLPSLIAGYGMLKRKSWGRVAGVIASSFALLMLPHGTALGIYMLQFLLGEKALRLYESKEAQADFHHTPPQMSAGFDMPYNSAPNFNCRERENVYAPPTEPPNWR